MQRTIEVEMLLIQENLYKEETTIIEVKHLILTNHTKKQYSKEITKKTYIKNQIKKKLIKDIKHIKDAITIKKILIKDVIYQRLNYKDAIKKIEKS